MDTDTTREAASPPPAAASDAPAMASDAHDEDVSGPADHSSSVRPSQRDKFAHTRGRRKRTSPLDLVVLEREYLLNPRPDKATRASIVGRVALTEKEVQIWFQNRRQMTRRKCRTWQPNEITSIIRSSQDQSGDDGADASFNADDSFTLNQTFTTEESYVRETQSTPSSSQEEPHGSTFVGHRARHSLDSTRGLAGRVVRDDPKLNRSVSRVSDVSMVSLGTTSSSFSDAHETPDVPQSAESQLDPEPLQLGTNPRRAGLKRKASAARLSTSLDGKAQVVIGNNSPSPFKKHTNPIERSKRAGAIQRSQSAVNVSSDAGYQLGEDIPEWRKAKPHGRSRDARSWEFYCDSDARNALAKTAEFDKNGSAQAVLGLIRSKSSSRKPLTPLGGENLRLHKTDDAHGKAAGGRLKRPSKLGRAMSSMAALGSPNTSKAKAAGKRGKGVEVWQDNFGDSDKENDDPDGPSATHAASSHGAGIALSSAIEKEPGVGVDPGVHQKGRSPRAARELDAVQQLLSLSQGAWQ